MSKQNVKKYRKKPVVIEALQWTGRNWTEVCVFCVDLVKANGASGEPVLAFDGRRVDAPELNRVLIRTLEGVMEAKAGDYIIKGVKGEFYPCRADIFAATYEEVEDVGAEGLVNGRTAEEIEARRKEAQERNEQEMKLAITGYQAMGDAEFEEAVRWVMRNSQSWMEYARWRSAVDLEIGIRALKKGART